MNEYSRSERRRSQKKQAVKQKPTNKRNRPIASSATSTLKERPTRIKAPLLGLLLVSACLSFFSVANPLLTDFADSIQSQYLYAGQAFLSGQIPYTDFYASSGLIYYFIGALGNLFNSTLLLILLQWIAFYFSGMTFYKITVYLSGQKLVGKQLLWAFYLLLGVLGFGGLYSVLFALPFVLNGLWFLLRYFSKHTRDEGFIRYGINAGLVFLIDPKSVLLWLVASLVLLVYNIRSRYKLRGFYQMLSTLFGFSLVVYSIGYYTILNKNFGAAITQTFSHQIGKITLAQFSGFQDVLPLLLFLLGTGLITSLIYGVLTIKRGGDRDFKVLLYLLFIVHLVDALFASHFLASNLIILVPFGLLLTGAYMGNLSESKKGSGIASQTNYLKLNAFLPLLAVLYLLVYPMWRFFSTDTLRADRNTAAAYIKENSSAESLMYAWDDNALVYLKSQRWAAAKSITPDVYLDNSTNQDNLILSIKGGKAQFILVRKSEELPETISQYVSENYQVVDVNVTDITLYQLK